MRCFSLFSGIGGFDLAAQRTGHEIVGACEIDKHARQIYERHFPNVKIWQDARTIKPEELPDFDILFAGFPCQAFSIAGRRLGFEESRGTLFFEIARIAKQKRPGLLLLENVVGLLSHDRGRTFAEILTALDEIGYDVEWQVLNSKYFVPQNRERVFIIGHLREKSIRQIFPIGEINQINGASCREAQTEGQWVRSKLVGAIDANYAKGGGSRTMIAWSKSTRDWGTESRMRYDEANTLNTGFGGRTQSSMTIIKEYDKVRALTPLECERLQGFPDNWTEGMADTHRYHCLGNAVTVPVVQYIFECLTLDRNCST